MKNPNRAALDLAWTIIDMQTQIDALERENEELREYKQKYDDLLDDSLKHASVMSGYMLKAALAGVFDPKEPKPEEETEATNADNTA